MTSSKKNGSSVSVEFSPRILELQKKIHDPQYVDNAVERIAVVLSRNLVEDRVLELAGHDCFVR